MDTELRIEIAVGKTMDSRTPPTVTLRVEDTASGEVMALVEVDAGQWLHLQSGTSLRLPGFVSSNLDRVGRKQVVRQLSIPRKAAPSYSRAEAEFQALNWAEPRAEEGETIEVRSTNAGWIAIYRSWP